VDFSTTTWAPNFADGVFVGEHGQFGTAKNRSAYSQLCYLSSNGSPSGPPVDFVSVSSGEDGQNPCGPVGVTV